MTSASATLTHELNNCAKKTQSRPKSLLVTLFNGDDMDDEKDYKTVGQVQKVFLQEMKVKNVKMIFENGTVNVQGLDEPSKSFFCKHVNKKFCAKLMCKSCYHKIGNERKATDCIHTDRAHYSKGVCKYCYFHDRHA